jgi:hypothetical protein
MRFSTFKAEKRNSILARSEVYDSGYRGKARVAFIRLVPTSRLLQQFDHLVGASADYIDMLEATAANGRARSALRMRVVQLVARLRRRHPTYAFYFGTVIHADWNTNSSDTVIDLADMHDRMRNVVRMCGFRGAIMMLEIQATPGKPRDESWPFFPHGHFIAWAPRPFNKRKAGQGVRNSKRLKQPEEAPVFVLSDEITTEADMLRRAAYLVKEPYSGKKRHSQTGRFERTIQDMHPEVCLRLTEVLSHIRMSELLLLTGDATTLRKELLATVPATVSNNRPRALPILAGNLWDSARANGTRFYPPVQVIRKPRSKTR